MKIYLYLRILLIVIIFTAFNKSYFSQTANPGDKNEKVDETGKLVNRRVLILDFVNSNNSKDHEYLETSIPDTFPGALNKTRSFELLSRSIWREMLQNQKVQKSDAYDDKIAVQMGESQKADVVVMGSFAASKDTIIIITRVLEVSSSRIMVSRTKITKIDNSIFESIKALAQELSAEMKEKLPPLPQQVITRERVKYQQENGETEKPKSGKDPRDRKFSLFFDPGMAVIGYYVAQIQIPTSNWTHLQIDGSYIDLTAWKKTFGGSMTGYYVGASYRFMMTAFNKSTGLSALNGLYLAPTFQFMNGTASNDVGSSPLRAFSFGSEVGHQWVFRNGFTLGVRMGYLFAVNDPPGSLPPQYFPLLIPFNIAGPTLHLDLGWSF
ncbi:MAG: hypothetical protein OEV66_02795 [Spirochaetia bacterium]|nr:hypothetical protein [Spirochaetia bacterium]